jgi:hypothetical protein
MAVPPFLLTRLATMARFCPGATYPRPTLAKASTLYDCFRGTKSAPWSPNGAPKITILQSQGRSLLTTCVGPTHSQRGCTATAFVLNSSSTLRPFFHRLRDYFYPLLFSLTCDLSQSYSVLSCTLCCACGQLPLLGGCCMF